VNDAEFRRRAHALLAVIDERWREEIGPVDLDSCADCGKHGAAHKSDCDLAALLAAGDVGSIADAFAGSLEAGMEKFMRGPCTCDVVGHAPECKARPAVPVSPEAQDFICAAPCDFPRVSVCWLAKGHEGPHEGVPF